MILLDTNTLIDLPADDILGDHEVGASILCRAELEFGVRTARNEGLALARADYLAALDRWLDWIPFDVDASRAYGFLATAMRSAGSPVRARRTDTFIAAQAYSLGVPLLTRNTADFAPIAHLVDLIDPGPLDGATP